ncbi:MAG: GNAT family N-acetyltransferase [Oscillospiraceae bacterium]|nr:GNAT family N-acetyltransferase [Oscillospiraceae bacterium]
MIEEVFGFEPLSVSNRSEAMAWLREDWGGETMVLRGEAVNMSCAKGVCAFEGGALVGLATYRFLSDACELLSLNSRAQGRGLGSALMQQVEQIAKAAGCTHMLLITTNDNTDALRFYQRRGYDIINIFRDALDAVRRLKPAVPTIGLHGIALRHEIELAKPL